MKLKTTLSVLSIVGVLIMVGCQSKPPEEASRAVNQNSPPPVRSLNASALPENGFKAQITVANAPALVAAGVDAIAVISAVFAHDDPAAITRAAADLAALFVEEPVR